MLEKNFKSACAKTRVIVEYRIEPIAYQYAREIEDFVFEKISNARRSMVNEELTVGDEYSRQKSFVDSINYHFETTSDAQNDLEEVGNLIDKFGSAWIKSKGGYSKVCPN